jgi:hypothetical protein
VEAVAAPVLGAVEAGGGGSYGFVADGAGEIEILGGVDECCDHAFHHVVPSVFFGALEIVGEVIWASGKLGLGLLWGVEARFLVEFLVVI